MSVSDNDLACICEIRPDIDNDILKILGDFVRIWQRPMAQIFLKRVRIRQRHFGRLSGVLGHICHSQAPFGQAQSDRD